MGFKQLLLCLPIHRDRGRGYQLKQTRKLYGARLLSCPTLSRPRSSPDHPNTASPSWVTWQLPRASSRPKIILAIPSASRTSPRPGPQPRGATSAFAPLQPHSGWPWERLAGETLPVSRAPKGTGVKSQCGFPGCFLSWFQHY